MQELQWDFIVIISFHLLFHGSVNAHFEFMCLCFCVRIKNVLYRVLFLSHRKPLTPATSSDSRGAHFNNERYKF